MFSFCLYENSRHQEYVIIENDDLVFHKKFMDRIHQQILQYHSQQQVQMVNHEKNLIFLASVNYFHIFFLKLKVNSYLLLSFKDKIIFVNLLLNLS